MKNNNTTKIKRRDFIKSGLVALTVVAIAPELTYEQQLDLLLQKIIERFDTYDTKKKQAVIDIFHNPNLLLPNEKFDGVVLEGLQNISRFFAKRMNG